MLFLFTKADLGITFWENCEDATIQKMPCMWKDMLLQEI